jgi:hypothetical protein
MRVAEAFAEAYALGSSTASVVCLTALVIVPRLRLRFAARRGHRRLAEFLAEAAGGQ